MKSGARASFAPPGPPRGSQIWVKHRGPPHGGPFANGGGPNLGLPRASASVRCRSRAERTMGWVSFATAFALLLLVETIFPPPRARDLASSRWTVVLFAFAFAFVFLVFSPVRISGVEGLIQGLKSQSASPRSTRRDNSRHCALATPRLHGAPVLWPRARLA